MNRDIPIYDVLMIVRGHWAQNERRGSFFGLLAEDARNGYRILEVFVERAIAAKNKYEALDAKRISAGARLLPIATAKAEHRAEYLDRKARRKALSLMRQLVHRNHSDLVLLRTP